jgi:tetratricopeptide (TPR) repeat protein
MHRHLNLVVIIVTMVLSLPLPVYARGGGGGGRGGGGGGGGRGGGGFSGGGGMSRPSSVGRSPSMSRPAAPSRPAGAGGRPSAGARPGGGPGQAARPPGLTPGSRPGTVDFSRPGSGGLANRPSVGGPASGGRPGISDAARPSQLPSAQRPGAGQRPGGQGPGIATRPSLPGGSTALLPGLGNRPGIGDRPGGGANRPGQLPARSPQERRGDLQDRLGSRDQGNRRDDIRQDWQDRSQNISERHDNWHHGYWHGNASGWWNHMWSDHTALMAFGTTMWGLNRLAYGFGYWGYNNPYYSEPYANGGGGTIDYSQPIQPDTTANTSSSGAPAPGIADFDAARQSFYQGDYAAALASTNKALAALPNDPIIHEFRALVLFAQGKYKEAAPGLYSVMAVGPGWDWTTLVSLYPNVDVYTKQLRALEAHVKGHPQESDAQFVLVYHYLTMGDSHSKDAAASQLKKLYMQMPQDKVVKELLLMTGGPEAIGATPSVPEPTKPSPGVVAADFLGKWGATGENKTKFALDLTKDGNFSWTYTQGSKSDTVRGVYAFDGNVLAMEPESGGVMLAEVTQPDSGRFGFQLLGAPPGDPGLTFTASR